MHGMDTGREKVLRSETTQKKNQYPKVNPQTTTTPWQREASLRALNRNNDMTNTKNIIPDKVKDDIF